MFPVEKKWLGNMNQTTELKLVFLSRIGPKKNLLFALDVFRRCKINIVFDIYGPIDDAKYWERCQAVIHEMGSNVRVTYGGPIPYYEVSEVLSQYHYFILPTLGENFCHAVFEAFSAGCPVIISDKTFWRGLDEKHIGWDISLEEDWVELIERCATIDANEYLEMRTSCFEFARSHVSTSEALESSYRMLVELT